MPRPRKFQVIDNMYHCPDCENKYSTCAAASRHYIKNHQSKPIRIRIEGTTPLRKPHTAPPPTTTTIDEIKAVKNTIKNAMDMLNDAMKRLEQLESVKVVEQPIIEDKIEDKIHSEIQPIIEQPIVEQPTVEQPIVETTAKKPIVVKYEKALQALDNHPFTTLNENKKRSFVCPCCKKSYQYKGIAHFITHISPNAFSKCSVVRDKNIEHMRLNFIETLHKFQDADVKYKAYLNRQKKKQVTNEENVEQNVKQNVQQDDEQDDEQYDDIPINDNVDENFLLQQCRLFHEKGFINAFKHVFNVKKYQSLVNASNYEIKDVIENNLETCYNTMCYVWNDYKLTDNYNAESDDDLFDSTKDFLDVLAKIEDIREFIL